MRSVCFSMVKNEEDIIEAFVRHTLGQVDHLFIADNLSTDGTRDILEALAAEGLPLTVSVDPAQAMEQNVKMTSMYRRHSAAEDFGFAFFLDADEFLQLDKDRLHSVTRQPGHGRAFYIPRQNYVYTGEPEPGNVHSVFARMTTLDSLKMSPKSMIFHDVAGCRRFHIGNGNHHVRDWAQGGKTVSEEQPRQFASILHFPIRSIDQYLGKSLLGWLAMQLREPGVNEAPKTIGSHWRTQYRLVLEANAAVTEELLKKNLYGPRPESRHGEEQPFAADFPIRYAGLMRHESVMVQLVKMYSLTIEGLWQERTEWEQRLAEAQAPDPKSSLA